MNTRTVLAPVATVLILVQPVPSPADAAGPEIRTERVQFAKGASSAVPKGHLKGDSDVDYVVRAGTGQTFTVTLKKTNSFLRPAREHSEGRWSSGGTFGE